MLKVTIEVIEGRKVMVVDDPRQGSYESSCELCCFKPLPACLHIPCGSPERADERDVIFVELIEEPEETPC